VRQRKLVVMTDVDGCVLDRESRSHAGAEAALDRLKLAGVPVILCSSRTRAELERLQQELGLADPFIAENGGALFAPSGAFQFPLPGAIRREPYDIVEFGKPHRDVADLLRKVAGREGIPIVAFSEMSVQDVAGECGLPLAAARLAKLREYDEPFRLVAPDPAARARLCRALRTAGLRCSSAGRFDHVTSGANKGLAAVFLHRCYLREWGEVTAVGLGDSGNDLELLRAVDVPVVVRGPDAAAAAALAGQVRGARVSLATGPAGWSEAVVAILDQQEWNRAEAGGPRRDRRTDNTVST
jgi:mannosyl-3-phosphoglycerate phosphatase